MKSKSNQSGNLRIAVVSESVQIGGGEMMAARLATYLHEDDVEIKFFIIGKYVENQITQILNDSGIDYECLSLPTSFDFRSYISFANALNRFRPDVVHEHLDACYSWVWCILNNIPLIATMHSDPYRRKSRRVALVMKLKAYQKNLRVIGCSKKTAELIKACYKLPEQCVSYIHNPIDISLYKQSKHDTDIFNFVHIGRFHAVKNHNLLIDAFDRAFNGNKKVRLYLAGDGPLLEKMQEKTKELGLNDQVTFLGNVVDIPNLLDKMDVLVLSSLSEAFPMVVLEGMAAGLPIISTNVGGVPEAVTDNGILVENSVDALAHAMDLIASDNRLLLDYSLNSVNNVKKFDKSVITKKYMEEYIKLVNVNE